MTILRSITGSAGLIAVLLGAVDVPSAAELQDCFRDGYLCSLACDRAGGGKSEVAKCEARCNEEERICIGKAAQAQPAYSPAIAPIKARWSAGANPVR